MSGSEAFSEFQKLKPENQVGVLARQGLRFLPDLAVQMAREDNPEMQERYLCALRLGLTLYAHLAIPDQEWAEGSHEWAELSKVGVHSFPRIAKQLYFETVMTVLPSLSQLLALDVELGVPLHIYESFNHDVILRSMGVLPSIEAAGHESLEALMRAPLSAPSGSGSLEQKMDRLRATLPNAPENRFWYAWLNHLMQGTQPDWDVIKEVLRLPSSDWERGPKYIAGLIDGIETKLVTLREALTPMELQKKIQSNAPLLALMQAAGKANLEEAREKLRGENGISEETRDKLSECIERLDKALDDLLAILSLPAQEPEVHARAKKWWSDFSRSNRALAQEYSSAENLSNAAFPTALILMCTAVGSFFGQTLAGSVVGAMIAREMKPSQAAKELGQQLDF